MHDPVVAAATKVHVTAVPEAGVAVSVTVAPTVNPPILIFGVLILVILSVLEVPESEAVSRVGAAGTAKAPRTTVLVSAGNWLE